MWRADCLVPASANLEHVLIRNDVHQTAVCICYLVEHLGGAIGRMVIDHNDIEWEGGLLRQC